MWTLEPLDFKLRPDSSLPVPFFLTGLVGLAALLTAAALDPRALLSFPPGPRGVFLLHLAVLGWLAPVMLGAYYQLVPVVLHAPVPAPQFGRPVLVGLAAGVVVFLAGWLRPDPRWVAVGGTLAGAALYGFLVHMAAALRRLGRWSVPALAFALALAFLAATAALGPILALTLAGVLPLSSWARLVPIHATVGLSGWLALTVVGASYQLLPFFAATEPKVRARFGYLAVPAVALGACAVVAGAGPAGGGATLAGLLLWALDLARMARHGRQARREPVVTFSGLAVAALLVSAAGAEALLAGWAARPGAVAGLAALGLVTGPALLILGQLQKILPFLASLDVALAAKRQGRVPKTEALFPRRAAFALLLPLGAGLFGLAAAAGLGSAAGVRAAAGVAALASYAYLLYQSRAAHVWWRARRLG